MVECLIGNFEIGMNEIFHPEWKEIGIKLFSRNPFLELYHVLNVCSAYLLLECIYFCSKDLSIIPIQRQLKCSVFMFNK